MPPPLSLDVPLELIKDPRLWTVEDIGVWLQWLGIGEHVETFAAQRVDGRMLMRLGSDFAWADLGVVDPEQQRVIDSAVEPLRCFPDSENAESGIVLQAIEGPVAGEIFYVGSGGITGGRHSASNGIVLSENYVSRRHFQVTCDRTGQFMLMDVGSTTGTFLMVRDELALCDRMVLQLGTTELTVYIDGGDCTLVATEGPDKDARASVAFEPLYIGREATNGFCIRDPQISAFHCEVRRASGDQGFVLSDPYSTNRTWIRLAPDGQPSRRYHLGIGDLFKVGSALFHVVDPSESVPAAAVVHGPGAIAASPDSQQLAPEEQSASDGEREATTGTEPREGAHAGSTASSDAANADIGNPSLGSRLHWEPFGEGQARPVLPPDEYARLVTLSRRRMYAASSRAQRGRRSTHTAGGEPQPSSHDIRERELSSMQQRMRNSRAQAAYTLQQQRIDSRRDEDLCKICYDRDIDVVLYPCGHFILCQWCAAKVSDCPVCRFVITDVIRTYKA